MKCPRLSRIAPVSLRVSQIAARIENDLRFAVAGQIAPGGRFVVDNIEDFMTHPMFSAVVGHLALRVFVPGSVFSGKTVDQDISPAVLVEVVGEGEEVV